MIAVFVFVGVIDAEQCACEGGDLAKADEERFMDLSFRLDEDPAEKQDHASDGEQRGCEQLYVRVVFHGVF